jgi:hypothetical protein
VPLPERSANVTSTIERGAGLKEKVRTSLGRGRRCHSTVVMRHTQTASMRVGTTHAGRPRCRPDFVSGLLRRVYPTNKAMSYRWGNDQLMKSRARTMPRWFGAGGGAGQAIAARFHKEPSARTFFHYTNAQALISIVENNELWLSEATFLNDRTEVRHGESQATARLEQAIKDSDHSGVAAMFREAGELFRIKAPPDVYVACFSWDGDDLGQWRAYGDAGVSIELEHGPLMFGYSSESSMMEVRYEPSEQDWIFEEVLKSYAAAYAQDLSDPLPPPEPDHRLTVEEERTICAAAVYHALWRQIVACKEETFKRDREVRYIYTAHDFSDSARSWYPVHQTPQFRVQSGRIVPYLTSNRLDFANMKPVGEVPKLPIKSVRIGPRDDQQILERGVRKLLDAYGYREVPVMLSNTSLRR